MFGFVPLVGLVPVLGLVPFLGFMPVARCGVPGRRSPAGVLGSLLVVFLLLRLEWLAAVRTDASSNKVEAAAFFFLCALPVSFPGCGGSGRTWVWWGEEDGEGVAILVRVRGTGWWPVFLSPLIHPPLSGRGGKGMEMATARRKAASSLLRQRGYWLFEARHLLSNLLVGRGGEGEAGDGEAEFRRRRWPYPSTWLHHADDVVLVVASGRFGGLATSLLHLGAQHMDGKIAAMICGQEGQPSRRPVGASSTSMREAISRVSCRRFTPPGCEVICSPQPVVGGRRRRLAVGGDSHGLHLTSCYFSMVFFANLQDCFRGVFIVRSCVKIVPTVSDV